MISQPAQGEIQLKSMISFSSNSFREREKPKKAKSQQFKMNFFNADLS
jgi:hypothetical protein